MMIEPCKICGKIPRLIMVDGYCVVRCKPFFERTHYVVEAFDYVTAIKYWNEANKTT